MKSWRNKVAATVLGLMLAVVSFAALETGTYISDLVVTNPTSNDTASQGDDHIRLIKNTVKTTFPNITGAVTPTHTELNYVDGVTSALQTQIDAKQATITGGATSIATSNLTASRVLVSDGSGKVGVSAVTSTELTALDGITATVTELNYTDGVTSAIQTQLNTGGINITGKTGTAKTLSTSAASGGSNGDIWYRY